jgi:hypothetical protein
MKLLFRDAPLAIVGEGAVVDKETLSADSRSVKTRTWASTTIAALLFVAAIVPTIDRLASTADAKEQRDAALARLATSTSAFAQSCGEPSTIAVLPAYADAGALASWQTIGGCGAGASTGAGGGLKWIGRGTTGGYFNVQLQSTYSRISSDPERPEHHFFNSALITRPLTDRWTLGVSLPVVYKYMVDPYETDADLSNSGLGDMSFLVTGKFGSIGATSVTATVGLPTGEYKGEYRLKILNQSQQRGFGKPTASLTIDHVGDEIWGLTTIGAMASWRGGENEINNYRAPTAGVYGHVGYFLGPLVPAIGLTISGLTAHDRDQTVEQVTGLYLATPSVTVEWAGDLVAIIIGASMPYQYDGILEDTQGAPRSPWGFGPWTVGLGLSFSPF